MQIVETEEKKGEKRSFEKFGLISTVFVFIAAPISSIFVESPIGWIFHAIAASTGLYYQIKRKDKEMSAQFAFFFVTNVIAIITRLIP